VKIAIRENQTGDRTSHAVFRQLEAMAVPSFEVGILDSVSERMIVRTWRADMVAKSILWLRYQNLRARNIYIRPAGEHGLSLIDDLRAAEIKHMKETGFRPALVVETSPHNFQAWVRHGRVLGKVLSTSVAKALARKFSGDQGSADWRHFGRLAGFTNRKEKYRDINDQFPYVRVIEASGAVYERAEEFVRETEQALERETRQRETQRKLFQSRPQPLHVPTKAIEHFRDDPKYGGAQSRSDMAYAIYALDHGAEVNAVRQAIASQDLSFKGSPARQAEYVDRIIEKAGGFLEDRHDCKAGWIDSLSETEQLHVLGRKFQ
jgi:hypothetical protein